jgi:hypothetical protein
VVQAFGRRPSESARIATTGRHPKPFTKPEVLGSADDWSDRRKSSHSQRLSAHLRPTVGVYCMIRPIAIATAILVATAISALAQGGTRRPRPRRRTRRESSDRPGRCTTATTPICNYRPSRTPIGRDFGPNQVPRAMLALPRPPAPLPQVPPSGARRPPVNIDYRQTYNRARVAAFARAWLSGRRDGQPPSRPQCPPYCENHDPEICHIHIVHSRRYRCGGRSGVST